MAHIKTGSLLIGGRVLAHRRGRARRGRARRGRVRRGGVQRGRAPMGIRVWCIKCAVSSRRCNLDSTTAHEESYDARSDAEAG